MLGRLLLVHEDGLHVAGHLEGAGRHVAERHRNPSLPVTQRGNHHAVGPRQQMSTGKMSKSGHLAIKDL